MTRNTQRKKRTPPTINEARHYEPVIFSPPFPTAELFIIEVQPPMDMFDAEEAIEPVYVTGGNGNQACAVKHSPIIMVPR